MSAGMRARTYASLSAALAVAVVLAVSAEQASPRSVGFVYKKQKNPDRVVVSDSGGRWLATFTKGSYTVTLAGAARTFAERTATYPLTTSVWIRELAAPFGGTVDTAWLARELPDASLDVLAVAMRYVKGAPPLFDSAGLKIAGDAD